MLEISTFVLPYFIVLVFMLIVLRIINTKKKQNHLSEEDFVVSIKLLSQVVNEYKTNMLEPKKQALAKKYDIDPSSQTNAIPKYNGVIDVEIRKGVKDILDNYISKTIKDVLMTYYNENSLILTIITMLK